MQEALFLTSLYVGQITYEIQSPMQDLERVLELNLIEQLNFFNWLSNVKNLVVSNGSEHGKMRSNVIKIAFFLQKVTKSRTATGCSAPRSPLVMHFSYTKLLNTSPDLDTLTF